MKCCLQLVQSGQTSRRPSRQPTRQPSSRWRTSCPPPWNRSADLGRQYSQPLKHLIETLPGFSDTAVRSSDTFTSTLFGRNDPVASSPFALIGTPLRLLAGLLGHTTSRDRVVAFLERLLARLVRFVRATHRNGPGLLRGDRRGPGRFQLLTRALPPGTDARRPPRRA